MTGFSPAGLLSTQLLTLFGLAASTLVAALSLAVVSDSAVSPRSLIAFGDPRLATSALPVCAADPRGLPHRPKSVPLRATGHSRMYLIALMLGHGRSGGGGGKGIQWVAYFHSQNVPLMKNPLSSSF